MDRINEILAGSALFSFTTQLRVLGFQSASWFLSGALKRLSLNFIAGVDDGSVY